MVESIEHLCAELDPDRLGYVEGLDETEIDIPVIGCHENVSTSAVHSWSGNTKRLRQIYATAQSINWLEKYRTSKR